MKKILSVACILSLLIGSRVFAAETYTGGLVDSLNQKINKVASPVVNKEKEVKAKQKAIQELKQKQLEEQKKQAEARQKAQKELIEKKKQQIQDQKTLFNQQKEEIKNIFKFDK